MNAPKKRRWQFTLRAMFLVVTAIGVCLGLVIERAREHQRAIDFMREIGASISYDYQWSPTHAYLPDAYPPGKRWIKRILGEHYKSNVWQLELYADTRHAVPNTAPEKLTDEKARYLATFTEADWLLLDDTNLTDAGLVHFYKLKKLGRLDIRGSRITAEGVAKLRKQLPNVKFYWDDDL